MSSPLWPSCETASGGEDGVWSFCLSEEATEKCISKAAPTVQEDCALIYQIMCVLHPQGFSAVSTVNDLADILFYVDFSRIFDRAPNHKRIKDLQKKAEDLFRPEGVMLDFGRGSFRYLAFERSNSMSRQARLSFIREDFYAPVKERIQLGMEIGLCQLSKLYAYNGLMLTSGFRVEDMRIWNPRRVIVIENPVSVVHNADVITVVDDGTDEPMRLYDSVRRLMDVEVTEFDGEGLISPQSAEWIDTLFCGEHIHSSFQIRMPYIKGVVHEVDFKGMLRELGVDSITDIWGVRHPAEEVDLILNRSMFKGYGWMTENGLSWPEYLERCARYGHALYISGVSQTEPTCFTEMNYQFLSTADIRAEEFRPADLPLGWERSPLEDPRSWVTKETELRYYGYAVDPQTRLAHFASTPWANILQKNPLFLQEPVLTKELDALAEHTLREYAMGRLVVAGDNRYLSGDLLRFVYCMVREQLGDASAVELERESLGEGEVYAPGAAYAPNTCYTLLRNPHIARNEEAVAQSPEAGYFRNKYFSHLNYVVMVDSRTLIPERLGGADFDGDMVKTIADPLVNECIARNYIGHFDSFSAGIPVLKIPGAAPLIRDAGDWKARMETVRATFDSRIGQMCNAAFDRSVVACNENTDVEFREQLIREAEELEILTGLEIDSAKTGVKPQIDFYLTRKLVERSPFLKYKYNVQSEDGREWYEPTVKEKLKKFFAATDWENVTSNVERLPYLAKMLGEHTPKIKARPARDEELFTFARAPGWKDRLDPAVVDFTKTLIGEYESVLRRIRIVRIEPKSMARRGDIQRILFSRGQEEQFTAEELYGVFQNLTAEEIAQYRRMLRERQWHLMAPADREVFLLEVVPYHLQGKYNDLFADFRHNGYRLLSDVICDLDDQYRAEETRENALHRREDGGFTKWAMEEYDRERVSEYRALIAKRARQYINLKARPDEVLQCAIALGKRDFVFEVLLDRVEFYTAEV